MSALFAEAIKSPIVEEIPLRSRQKNALSLSDLAIMRDSMFPELQTIKKRKSS